MTQIKYNKIYTLGKPETADLVTTKYDVTVEEKVDGANMRVWYDGQFIWVGSRNHDFKVTSDSGEFMGGMAQWARDNWAELVSFFETFSSANLMVCGEWMQRHTINYNIKKPYFVAFDLVNLTVGVFLPFDQKYEILRKAPFPHIEPMYTGPFPGAQKLEELLNSKSQINPEVTIEGVVVKALDGNMAKLVRPEFKEKLDKIINKEKTLPKLEMELAQQVTTEARVRKLWLKGRDENPEYRGDMGDMTWLPKAVLQDILEEEWTDWPTYTLGNGDMVEIDENQYRKFVSNYTAKHLKKLTMDLALGKL